MESKAVQSQLTETLLALEALHIAEAQALTKLDHTHLEQITENKLALCELAAELGRQLRLTPEQRQQLERIRKAAFQNQLLALHARDAIRTILTDAGAAPPGGFGTSRTAAVQDGVRVNFRG